MTRAPTASYVHFLRLVEAGERDRTDALRGHQEAAIKRGHAYKSKLLGVIMLTPDGEQILACYGHKARKIKKPEKS